MLLKFYCDFLSYIITLNFSEGFSAIIHLHTAVEEVKIQRLLGKFNRKTKKMEKFTGAKFLKQGDQGICRFKLSNMVAMDKVYFLKD